MILVDTSVWIDHLHRVNPSLVASLERGDVLVHPLVIEELATGSLRHRAEVLAAMEDLNEGVTLSHDELLAFVDVRALWGKGLSLVDAQLLGAALLSRGAMTIWTRDKTLKVAAEAMQIAYAEES